MEEEVKINEVSSADIADKLASIVEKMNKRNFIFYAIRFLPQMEIIKTNIIKLKKKCTEHENMLNLIKIEIYYLSKLTENEYNKYCNYVVTEIDNMRSKLEEELMSLEDELSILKEETTKKVKEILSEPYVSEEIDLMRKNIEERMIYLEERLKHTEDTSISRLEALEDKVALSINELGRKIQAHLSENEERIKRVEINLVMIKKIIWKMEEVLNLYYNIVSFQVKLVYFFGFVISACSLLLFSF